MKMRLWLALVLAVVMLWGCSSSDPFLEEEINPNIDVLGIKLGMQEDQVHELAGSIGEKAMCINGYEYQYADKLINIGFTIDESKVRRVTTKNPDTSIFGIQPGMELAAAAAQLDQFGFTKDQTSEFKFHKETVMLTLISMHGDLADGVSIELRVE